MNSVLLVGAGFSRGIAEVPTTVEWLRNWRIFTEELPKAWRSTAAQVFFDIEELEKRSLEAVIPDHAEVISLYEPKLMVSVEKVFTLVDVLESLRFEGSAIVDDCHYSFDRLNIVDPFVMPIDLIRSYLQRLIAVIVTRDRINVRLGRRFNDYLGNRFKIAISLNYDLVLEKILYAMRSDWWPCGGYGNSFLPDERGRSSMSVLKPHGSMGWREDSFLNEYGQQHTLTDLEEGKVRFVRHDPYGRPFFSKRLRGFKFYTALQRENRGAFDPHCFVLPSLAKRYDRPHRAILTEMSFELQRTDELTAIGYRFPEEDEVIFTCIRSALGARQDAQLNVIDPNAEEICARIKHGFSPNVVIKPIPSTIQDFLLSGTNEHRRVVRRRRRAGIGRP